MTLLGNAFSLQMLDLSKEQNVKVVPATVAEVSNSGFRSVVGHQDTANVLTTLLGVEVAYNRESVKLGDGDVLYVAQVTGGRLPEGAMTLPAGLELAFLKVTL